MDGFNEKKWFVYIGDHHEGPFSLEELQPRFASGILGAQTYAWCEGMGDWQVVTELSAFSPLVSAIPGASAANAAADDPPAGNEPVIISRSPHAGGVPAGPAVQGETSKSGASGAGSDNREQSIEIGADAVGAASVDLSSAGLSRARNAGKKSSKSSSKASRGGVSDRMKALLVAFLLLIGVAMAGYQGLLEPVVQQPAVLAVSRTIRDFVQPYLIPALDRFPALGDYISPIPSLGDLSPEDVEDLRSAALGNVQTTGPKVSIALSREDPARPKFFVTTNMPNGTRFEVHVFGNGDSLVGHLGFSGTLQATALHRMGETTPLQMADGGALPRGEYFIYVMESGTQEENVKAVLDPLPVATASLPSGLPTGRRLVARKVYFLGGEKDGAYEQQLAEFHEKVKSKATAELEELRMLAAEFESRLSAGKSTFEKLRSDKLRATRVSKANRQKWEDFHGVWGEFESRLLETSAKWTSEGLSKDYFYGTSYLEAAQAFQSLSKLHAVHHSFFTGSGEGGGFEIQLGEAASQAQLAVSTFRSSVASVESAPLSPAGLPSRQALPEAPPAPESVAADPAAGSSVPAKVPAQSGSPSDSGAGQ